MVPTQLSVPSPCLALVTDRSLVRAGALPEVIEQAVSNGVQMVQLREKDLPGGPLLELATAVRDRINGRALFIVNERADVALGSRANGVHLGESGLPILKVREMVGDGLLIGRSVHSVEAAVQAEAQGANYLICGTIFETRSKPGKCPEGLPLLRAVTQAVRIPVLAIGGVTQNNAGSVLEAGASGACVVSAILASETPGDEARSLRAALGKAAPKALAS